MTEEERAEQNRSAFPETARILDEWRDLFGPDVQVTYIDEGGRTVGKPSSTKPGTWIGMQDMVIKKGSSDGKK